MTPNDYLNRIAAAIVVREKLKDQEQRKEMLDEIMFNVANALRVYCKQQGKNCEHCRFKLEDVERKSCECKINIGKNELGTAPRFWEL